MKQQPHVAFSPMLTKYVLLLTPCPPLTRVVSAFHHNSNVINPKDSLRVVELIICPSTDIMSRSGVEKRLENGSTEQGKLCRTLQMGMEKSA